MAELELSTVSSNSALPGTVPAAGITEKPLWEDAAPVSVYRDFGKKEKKNIP